MKFRLSIIAAVAALGLFAPGASCADEIRIATQPIPHYAPIFVAKKKGWLDEELAKAGAPETKWASFAAGPPINESFAAGQQDIGFLGDTPALIGRAAGIDTRIIGITSVGPKTLAALQESAGVLLLYQFACTGWVELARPLMMSGATVSSVIASCVSSRLCPASRYCA